MVSWWHVKLERQLVEPTDTITLWSFAKDTGATEIYTGTHASADCDPYRVTDAHACRGQVSGGDPGAEPAQWAGNTLPVARRTHQG